MRTAVSAAFAAAALLLSAAPAGAIPVIYNVPLDPVQEVDGIGTPNQGEPGASGLATLTLDAATDSISWSISVAGLTMPLSGAHIHQAPAGVNGGVVIDFSAALVGGPIVDADVDAVLANPTGYYVNLHNSVRPGGAIRGQIPEPGTLGLFAAALGGLALLRRSA